MREGQSQWRWGLALVVSLGLALPPATWAQAAKGKKAAPKVEDEIEEITVTAQKREENIQETPISVTALGTAALAEKGITNVVDLGQAVPNLRITSNPGSPASTTIAMRGVQQGDPQVAFQPKVGMYIDGVYIAKIVGSNFDLEDLERVEVLRGPQGTLYGRNTLGGAVNFITKKPTEEYEATVKTEVGNFDAFNGRVTMNAPVVGKNGIFKSDALGIISVRVTGGYKTHEGYYRNSLPESAKSAPNIPGLGGPASIGGAADYADLNRVYTTGAVRWQPTKDVTVDYSVEYHRYRDTVTSFQLTYLYPQNPLVSSLLRPYVQTNRSDVNANNAILMRDLNSLHPMRDDGRNLLHTLSLSWDLGNFGAFGDLTVKSISSYRTFFSQSDQDLDGSPIHISEFSQISDTQHWSQELQLLGTAPRLHYVLGAYYYGEYTMQNEDQVFFGGASNLPYKNFMKTKSYAPFGQATWTPPILADKLSITVGLRYSQEQVHLDHILNADLPTRTYMGGGKAFGGFRGPGMPGLSPMGKISYQWTDDLMTYVSVSRGFLSGGLTPTAPSRELFTTFLPERLTSFEAGIKSSWFDKRLRINTDGYFSYYQDLQQQVFHPSPGGGAFSEIGNAERAEIWGTEFEAAAIPVRGLEATANYSFIAPKYTKWTDIVLDPVTNRITGTEDVSSKRAFSHFPWHQMTIGVTYTAPPTSVGVFSAHIDTYWQDKIVFITNNNTPGAQADESWAYNLVNGRLAFAGIPLEKGTLDLAMFAHNLLDRKYRSYGIDFGPGLGYAGNVYGNPRTFGLQMTYNFATGA